MHLRKQRQQATSYDYSRSCYRAWLVGRQCITTTVARSRMTCLSVERPRAGGRYGRLQAPESGEANSSSAAWSVGGSGPSGEEKVMLKVASGAAHQRWLRTLWQRIRVIFSPFASF